MRIDLTPPLTGPQGQDARRIEYTRRSRRMLYGEHEGDVVLRLQEALPDVRRQAWGRADMSSNPFKSVCTAMATLYDSAPAVSGPPGAEALAGRVADVGFWELMQRGQRDTIGLREMWMRVTVAEGAPVFEPVPPDLVIAEATGDRPGVPVEIWHARLRTIEGEQAWTWDHLSVRDPAAPVYEVLRSDGTAYKTEAWPMEWRMDGRPVLPYVLYHAAQTPYIYDPYQHVELVEGSLTVALLRTFAAHVARNVAWRQRWMIDAEPVGAGAVDSDKPDGGRQSIIADPATIIAFRRIDADGANPQVGTFEMPAEPAVIGEYCAAMERRLVHEAGLISPDPQALGGDARSGFAISVNRDGQREVQRRTMPLFNRADRAVLALTAAQLNALEGTSYPTAGYTIAYRGIPQSASERQAHRVHVLELMEAGLMDRVTAYMELNPGVSQLQAMQALAAIDAMGAVVAQEAALLTGPDTEAQDVLDDSAPVEDVQATALNGAQVEALMALAERVVMGQLPQDVALALARIAFPGVEEQSLRDAFAGLASFQPKPETQFGGE